MVHAQSDDAYYSTFKTNEGNLLKGIDSLHYLDSSMDDLQNYHPAFRYNYGMLDLGNSGTAIHPIVFQLNATPGFDLGWHYQDFNRKLYSESSNLFKTKKPITSIFYKQGPNELIGLDIIHAQNIKPNWNMGVEFSRLKEDGFYLNQKTGSYNTRVFSWFHSKDYRYHMISSATWNRLDNIESGGIYTTESFDTLTGAVRNPLVRYFKDEVRNKLRSNTFAITQLYRFGEKRHFPTEAVDSLGRAVPDTIPTLIPQHQFSLRTKLQTYNNWVSVSSFNEFPYTNFYTDSVSTFDSTWYRNGEISLGYETGAFRNVPEDTLLIQERKLFFNLFLDINFIKVAQQNDYAAYTNIAVRSELGTRSWFTSRTGLYGKAYLGLRGYNAGDYDLHAMAAQHLSFFKLQAEMRLKAYAPDYFSYYYFGNHHFWYNQNLNKQKADQWGVSLSNKGDREWIKASYHLTGIRDYIYLGPDETPHQYNSEIRLHQAKLLVKLKHKWMNWHIDAVWQNANSEVLPLPRFTMKHSLFAEGWLFKKNLNARLGFDVFWCEKFSAPEYVPLLRSWKVQDNNNPFQVGNYPYVNVYATGKIKTVTFFLMFQHVADGLFGSSYYSSPYYPMQPRAFRLGIRWNMYE